MLRNHYYIPVVALAFLGSCKGPDKPTAIIDTESVSEVKSEKLEVLSSTLNVGLTSNYEPENVTLICSPQIKAFYSLRNYETAWTNATGLNSNGTELHVALQHVANYGLLSDNYPGKEIDHLIKKIESIKTQSIIDPLRSDLEILMSEAYFRLAVHLNRGMLDRDSLTYLFDIKSMSVDLPQHLSDAVSKNEIVKSLLALQPQFRAFKKLQKQTALFLESIKDSDIDASVSLPEDASDEDKNKFTRDFLVKESFISGSDAENDSLLAEAMKIFQRKNGLIQDGKAGKNTLNAMQVSKRSKFETILVNLERLRWTNTLPDAYIYVNTAAYKLNVIESDSIVRSHRVVIGSRTNITPEISSSIEYFEINPVWYVPYSISTKEILPKVKEDAEYLAKNNYRVYTKDGVSVSVDEVDWSQLSTNNFKYKIRQGAGRNNSLGSIKFIFPNEHSIYLHDTPSKSFFDRDLRTFSHGCVRLEDPMDLAYYLLNHDENEITSDSLDTLMDERITKKIYLQNPHPIYIKYYTCEVNELNELIFYKDVYNRDLKIRNAIFKKQDEIKVQLAERGI